MLADYRAHHGGWTVLADYRAHHGGWTVLADYRAHHGGWTVLADYRARMLADYKATLAMFQETQQNWAGVEKKKQNQCVSCSL